MFSVELMVIVEYCQYGNVQNILRVHRRQFIDQINRTIDKIDPNVSNRIAQNETVAGNPTSIETEGSESVQNNYTNAPRGGYDIKVIYNAFELIPNSMRYTHLFNRSSINCDQRFSFLVVSSGQRHAIFDIAKRRFTIYLHTKI